MNFMKLLRYAAFATLLMPASAYAQNPGIAPAGSIYGNSDASPNIPKFSTSITLTPPSGTYNPGINITQTGPSSGSSSGPTSFNTTTITYGANTTGSGSDPFGVSNKGVFGQRLNFVLSGPNVGGGLLHGFGAVMLVNSTSSAFGDAATIVGAALINAITANTGTIEGLTGYAAVNNGGSVNRFTGLESTANIFTGGAALRRAGVVLSNQGQLQGSITDAAIIVSSGVSGGEFKKFVDFSSDWLGGHGIAATADLFFADTTLTVANIFNMANVTVTGNILNFPFVNLTGAGILTLNQNPVTAASLTGVILHIAGNDNNLTRVLLDGYNTNPTLIFRRANNTNASPVALATDDNIAVISGRGYGSTAYSAGGRAQIVMAAAQAWTDANQGAYADIQTTPNNSTTIGTAVRVFGSTGIGVGTLSDPGAGLIYINSASFLMRNKTSWADGAAANAGTLTNAPAVGNPTKWIPVDDNGTTRYIPAW